MRGCVLSALVMLLVAADGYCIWQVHLLRGEVASLRQELARQQGEAPVSMADYLRDAGDALGRGEIVRAQADLGHLSEMAHETKQMADEQRRRLLAEIESARQSVAKGEADARRKLDQIARLLSQERPKADQTRR